MAIDTATKRRMVAGVPFGTGVTPDSAKGVAWRFSVAWSYYPPAAAGGSTLPVYVMPGVAILAAGPEAGIAYFASRVAGGAIEMTRPTAGAADGRYVTAASYDIGDYDEGDYDAISGHEGVAAPVIGAAAYTKPMAGVANFDRA